MRLRFAVRTVAAVVIVGLTRVAWCGDPGGIECISTAYLSWFNSGNVFQSGMNVCVRGDVAFVLDRSNGLTTIDVSDPFSPQVVSQLRPSPGSGPTYLTLETVDDYAYVGTQSSGGFFVLDIADPASLGVVRRLHETDSTLDVVIVGERMFVATGNELQVYSIAEPSDPRLLADNRMPQGAESVGVRGDVLAIARDTAGFALYDFSIVDAPIELSSVAVSGSITDLEFVGDILYAATSLGVINAFDCGDPQSPQLLATVEDVGLPVALRLDGDVMYVSDRRGAVIVLDVRAPEAPIEMGRYAVESARNTVSDGGLLYIADEAAGLVVAHAGRIPTSPVVSEYESDWISLDTLVADGSLVGVVSQAAGRAELIELDEAGALQLFSGVFDAPTDVALANERMYVADAEGILLAVPGTASPVRVLHDTAAQRMICVSDGLLYTTASNENLLVFRIDDSTGSLTPVGEMKREGWSTTGDICVDEGICVIATLFGFAVIDARDPVRPMFGSFVNRGGGYIEIENGLLWSSEWQARRVWAYDISDPYNPEFATSFSPLGRPEDVAVDGNLVAVAMRSEGIALYDTAQLDSPRLVGRYALREANQRINYGGTGLVVSHDGGPLFTELAMGACDGCSADLSAPWVKINFMDVAAYINLFVGQDERADIAPPFGSLNFFDVAEFITQFNAGCP